MEEPVVFSWQAHPSRFFFVLFFATIHWRVARIAAFSVKGLSVNSHTFIESDHSKGESDESEVGLISFFISWDQIAEASFHPDDTVCE